ncbi:MAG: electron transfer flavoprotein subunit alpha/FixB family protein [Desulfobacterota bacterium]|nr:electron transfer flavoprotein subunit alpha/FixB family protein [Thermodesulfobacteriota bacterium]MDW8001410.1 electron transfer flavoprotein subunit alpha/FixB family protein [Deltaproteobacteria bacterium]
MVNDVLAYVELKNNSVRKVSYEVLEVGNRLKESFGSKLYAALLGYGVESQAEDLKEYVDFVIVVDDERLKDFILHSYASALFSLVEKFRFSFILGPHTGYSRFLLPKVSCMLDWAIVADITGLEMKDGNLFFKKPLFGGRVISTSFLEGEKKAVVTVRPNSFPLAKKGSKGEVLKEEVVIKENPKIKFLRSEKKEEKKVALEEADFVICGGRGMRSPENFKILEEIAEIMGGRVGASRSVVDAKWRSYEEQIGKSGKTVSPLLYIACGISGAIHHTMGIDSSKTIVAINSDPNAPIFNIADYGIIDDLFEILPLLKEELKKAKEEI